LFFKEKATGNWLLVTGKQCTESGSRYKLGTGNKPDASSKPPAAKLKKDKKILDS
jgi:hypothetical protein